ncbi:MAG: MATE family efflux transporter [Gemmatimonadetes bacterium]|nr:MATE family efflux transporter [Gemmatimonadota bacterium]MCC7134554.1 MATE family efflux transporter [Gemmatimonadales bacterium]
MNSGTEPLTRRRAFSLAWPLFFSSAAVPLASLVDTAVIGAAGTRSDLGGVALGGTLFNLVYWSFYFLRMTSTGLAAQARGAGQSDELVRVLLRALGLGLALGALTLLIRQPFSTIGFRVLQGSDDVEAAGASYFLIRSWGAPGAYASFAVTGWLIGVGRTRAVLGVQFVFSAVNVVLDLWFVLGLGWGVAGVAAATAIADVVGALVAVAIAIRIVRREFGGSIDPRDPALWTAGAMARLFSLNVAMMIRSWALLAGFAWFTNSGARLGTATLAANHVLLQIVTVWAFVLDGYAYIAEAEVGHAVGARSREALRRAIRITTELAIASGGLFMLVTLVGGPTLLAWWISDVEVAETARRFLPYCAVIPFVGAIAWQLDGVFVGMMASSAMRNASVAALVLYVGVDRVLTPNFGAHGLWLAFVCYYLARAGTLGVQYRTIERRVTG